jgi:hypothetical protein
MHVEGAVGFSPDGSRLFTAGGRQEAAVKLWDTATYRELVALPGQGWIFGSVLTMVLLGISASAFPAMRALAVNPSKLMREE